MISAIIAIAGMLVIYTIIGLLRSLGIINKEEQEDIKNKLKELKTQED